MDVLSAASPPAELTVNDDCLDNEDRESDRNVVSSVAKPAAGEMIGADDGVGVDDGVAEGVEEGPNKETIAGPNDNSQGNAGNDNANQDDWQWEQLTQTRSGRFSKPVQHMGGSYDHIAAMALSKAEMSCQVSLRETAML
eukprot:11236725-Ditylum_brightwellii.AAC.1